MINEMEWTFRLLSALAAGAILGLERQIRGKAAGLKTIIMICVGSCLFMIISEIVGSAQLLRGQINYVSDPGRIAAQVVTGIGFLGAGVIIHSKAHVQGLTTAAVIWVSAGIGMMIGIGYKHYGILISISLVLVLVVLHLLEIGPLSRFYNHHRRTTDEPVDGKQ